MSRQRGVVVTRGSVVESRHAVHVAIVDEHGALVASVGDPSRTGFLRSVAKPWQALPLVEDGVVDALGFTDEELALCCASHNTERPHVDGVRSILAKTGLSEDALRCGPHMPIREEVGLDLMRAGVELTGIHSNCSGKHAGMLALAAHHGWVAEDYLSETSPVQKRMFAEVLRWTGLEAGEVPRAADGCGVPTYSVPMSSLARGFATFAYDGGASRRVVAAMTSSPFMVAGTGRLCTDLMDAAGERVYCKTGAEGLYGAGRINGAVGIGIKVEDGGTRAGGVALLAVLEQLGILDSDDMAALSVHARPPRRNTLGEVVGYVSAELELRWT